MFGADVSVKVFVLVSTLHTGGRGGLEASWWIGENKSCLQNKSSRFGKNVGGGDSKVSIIKLLHGGCSSAAYPPAGQPWPRVLFSF